MEILKGIGIRDLALWVKPCLIIGDIHIGYEEALNKQGVLIPRFQFKEVLERLERILQGIKPKKILINGDLKHEFGTISGQEWRHTLQLLDFLAKHCGEVVLVKGNHDTILGPIAEKRKVKVVDYAEIESKHGKMLVIHGDRIPEDVSPYWTIITGHEHPAVSLKEGPRVELVKCFLVVKYKRKNLIVMPSFNLVVEGHDILKERLYNPFIEDLANMVVYVVADKVYPFGKVKELIR